VDGDSANIFPKYIFHSSTVPGHILESVSPMSDSRLRNDLYCVGWGVRLYSLTHTPMSDLVEQGRILGGAKGPCSLDA